METKVPEIRPLSANRQKCKPCPFCGSIPYIDLGKRGTCQLHGEPFQSVLIHCKKHECPAHPSIAAGDIYNGGKELAEDEAIEKWNTRSA